jgi:hypothetical protein
MQNSTHVFVYNINTQLLTLFKLLLYGLSTKFFKRGTTAQLVKNRLNIMKIKLDLITCISKFSCTYS